MQYLERLNTCTASPIQDMIKDYLVNFLSIPVYAFTVKKLDLCVKEI